jgi:hypothetical protein
MFLKCYCDTSSLITKIKFLEQELKVAQTKPCWHELKEDSQYYYVQEISKLQKEYGDLVYKAGPAIFKESYYEDYLIPALRARIKELEEK